MTPIFIRICDDLKIPKVEHPLTSLTVVVEHLQPLLASFKKIPATDMTALVIGILPEFEHRPDDFHKWRQVF